MLTWHLLTRRRWHPSQGVMSTAGSDVTLAVSERNRAAWEAAVELVLLNLLLFVVITKQCVSYRV
jgi:uncharacterized integral membrane protein